MPVKELTSSGPLIEIESTAPLALARFYCEVFSLAEVATTAGGALYLAGNISSAYFVIKPSQPVQDRTDSEGDSTFILTLSVDTRTLDAVANRLDGTGTGHTQAVDGGFNVLSFRDIETNHVVLRAPIRESKPKDEGSRFHLLTEDDRRFLDCLLGRENASRGDFAVLRARFIVRWRFSDDDLLFFHRQLVWKSGVRRPVPQLSNSAQIGYTSVQNNFLSAAIEWIRETEPTEQPPRYDAPSHATAASLDHCSHCISSLGLPKKIFRSERDATLFIDQRALEGHATQRAYACPVGNGWHLTSRNAEHNASEA